MVTESDVLDSGSELLSPRPGPPAPGPGSSSRRAAVGFRVRGTELELPVRVALRLRRHAQPGRLRPSQCSRATGIVTPGRLMRYPPAGPWPAGGPGARQTPRPARGIM